MDAIEDAAKAFGRVEGSRVARYTALVVVMLMMIGAFLPSASAAPAPDLVLDSDGISVSPTPLVEGVDAVVSFNITNIGEQNAFNLLISLFDHGVEVGQTVIASLPIGEEATDTIPWLPTTAGVYDLRLFAWYGPESSKQDQDWVNNNATYTVNVRSRPNVVLTGSDLSFTAPRPDYVVDGDEVTIRANVRNLGTADISTCNVSLWERQVGGSYGELIDRQVGVTVPGADQTQVVFVWNTTGWSGKRRMWVDVEGVRPNETDLSNNRAYIDIKIHTKEDRVFDATESFSIDTDFKIQFFITIKDEAKLSILENGNATMFQDFDDQYDVEVMDSGQLVIDGGMLSGELNYTVHLMGTASLVLRNGADVRFRIISEGACDILIEDSVLHSPSITMAGGSLEVVGSHVTTDRLNLHNTDLHVSGSSIEVGEQVMLNGPFNEMWDTEFKVVRFFEEFPEALLAYPSLEFYDSETYETNLPPAIVATGGAVVNLYNVSVESQVYVEAEDNTFWTLNRLGAEGRTSVIHIHRYLDVMVRDWADQVVEAADVDVLDYFEEKVIVSGTTDDEGNVRLVVETDYVTEAQRPYVGNLRVRASAFGRTSDDVWFSHSKYPQMDFDSNVLEILIKLPPNPHAPIGEVYRDFDSDHLIEGFESSLDKNIIITDATLFLVDTTFTLEQEWDYQWFILVRGTSGRLFLENATLRSDYAFAIYLEGAGALETTLGSNIPNARIIAQDLATIRMRDSWMSGGIYAVCEEVDVIRSKLQLADSYIDANRVSFNGGTLHFWGDLYIKGDEVEIIDIEMAADYKLTQNVGVSDLRALTRFFGWSILNDYDNLVNRSADYFEHFATGTNLTIEATRLTISGALLYAEDVNIIVRRSTIPDQTIIEGSWIGGINLTVQSDDMYAKDSSFNRVLDNFRGVGQNADRARLYNVKVPGIVCFDDARVERYWFLSVLATDGAGSIRPGALLEVISTETNETLYPLPGTANLPSSRTDIAGRITVAIKANITDSTGDYFVGSIRFRLTFDKQQFSDDPVHTAWRQVNLKANLDTGARFPVTIDPPKKEMIYAIYNVTYAGPAQDLKTFKHTFMTDEEYLLFLNETVGVTPERERPWDMIRNTTVQMVFRATSQINNVWIPLADGEVRIYILQGPTFDPNNPFQNADGTVLRWVIWPDEDGIGYLNITVPDTLGAFQLYIEVSGGTFDPTFQPVSHRLWNFTVSPPQTIEIVNAWISPDRVTLGELMTVSGTVRYIYGTVGVEGAEISVTGTHIGTGQGRTDAEGRFTIQMQAPLLVVSNLSMVITAVDPATDQVATYTLWYEVYPPPKVDEPDEFNWKAVMIALIALGIVFSVIVGSVMVYRRHYGDLVECGECGAFIAANSVSCPKCGIEFETDLARCSECEAWIPANSPACPVCGTAFTIESLEEMVAAEEAEEELAPIDQVTTSTAKITPLHLDRGADESKWGEREEKRRRRIKKRVKKRLSVADAGATSDEEDIEDTDLYIGDEDEATRLPGLGVDESALSDEELSRLLPTEDMLKELMLTSEQAPEGEEPTMDLEEELLGEEGVLEEIEPEEGPEPGMGVEPEEEDLLTPEEEVEVPAPEEEPLPDQDLEEIPAPEEAEVPIPEEAEAPAEEEALPESRELLSELGLVADMGIDEDLEAEGEEEDESALSGLISEEEPEKEAPKLCPNCGGNWILYKDGEYTCRICGETW